jgi:hypothetical protein
VGNGILFYFVREISVMFTFLTELNPVKDFRRKWGCLVSPCIPAQREESNKYGVNHMELPFLWVTVVSCQLHVVQSMWICCDCLRFSRCSCVIWVYSTLYCSLVTFFKEMLSICQIYKACLSSVLCDSYLLPVRWDVMFMTLILGQIFFVYKKK